jgi:hypothetical protein
MQTTITLTELEAAINFWRQRSPSIGEELRLCPEASALATPYALLIYQRRQTMAVDELSELAQQAWSTWLQTANPSSR